MILPGQTIRRLGLVTPFFERARASGSSYGLGPSGYDIRLAQDVVIPAGGFRLASTIERFAMPDDVLGVVHDKSTWARRGLSVFNTIIEPGWRGFLTLELSNENQASARHWTHSQLVFKAGTPIAQVIFHRLEEPAEQPYSETGKYQDQRAGPQPAILD